MNFKTWFVFTEARARTQIIRRGEILYHGTSSEEDFGIPDGPAWFSHIPNIADRFKTYHIGKRPRTIAFKVIRQIPKMLTIISKQDFETALGEDYPNYNSNDLADEICSAGYNGWIIPHNYGYNQDDVMICHPSDYLEVM